MVRIDRDERRIGLSIEERKDTRLKKKWSAGFLAFFRGYTRDVGIPALIESALTREQFLAWFHQYKPDLVVGHQQIMVTWLQEAGVRVPEDVGYSSKDMFRLFCKPCFLIHPGVDVFTTVKFW